MQRESSACNETALGRSRRGRGRPHAICAKRRQGLIFQPAVRPLSSSAAPPQLCPALVGHETSQDPAAFGMPTTPCRSYADRRQSRDVAKSRGIEAETGMISEHRNRPAVRIGVFFSFQESSFESKLKGVGPGVADASDRPRRPPPADQQPPTDPSRFVIKFVTL